MWLILFIAVFLLWYGVAKFIAVLRRKRSEDWVGSLTRTREIAIACNFVLFSGIFALTGLPSSSVGATIMVVLYLLFVVGLTMVWTLRTVIKRAGESKANSLPDLIRQSWRSAVMSVNEWAKSLSMRLAPQGWGEIRPSSLNLEKQFSFRNFIWLYVVFFFLAAALSAIFLVQELTSSPGDSQALLVAILGVNVLLVASCLTVIVILSLVAMAFLRQMRVLQYPLDLGGALPRLAGFVGVGTALGGFTAALIPIVSYVFPASEAGNLDQVAIAATISPQMFFDLPAAGAVLGYIIGMLGVVTGIGRNAKNLIYAHLLGPLTFILIFVMLSANGLSPESIFKRAAVAWKRTSGATCLSEKDLETMLGSGADQTSVLLAADGCHMAVVIGNEFFVGMVIWVVAVWSVTALLWQSLKPRKHSANDEVYADTELNDSSKQ